MSSQRLQTCTFVLALVAGTLGCGGQSHDQGAARTTTTTTTRTRAVTPQAQPASGSRDIIQALFVQSAKGARFQGKTLTLEGVSPTTVFFSDRPQRVAGHMSMDEFLAFWSEGSDSFARNPPNATLSMLAEGGAHNVVVELRNPRLHGDRLTYDVRVLGGQAPAAGETSSLFIDIVGMPRTPVSYAGAARRTGYRAGFYY